MAIVDMKADAPVGAIAPYFGQDLDVARADGWLPCDGAILAREAWADLFAAIGTAFGTTSDVDFCLPDLRGLFARSPDAGAGRDKDVATRTASGPNGTGGSGDNVGSLQLDATASPTGGGFKLSGRFDFGGNKTHDGCSDSTRIKSADASMVALGGGDAESRPVNFNGLFIIKARPNISTDRKRGQLPLGSGLALPYDQDSKADGIDLALKGLLDDYWRYCNGQTFVSADGSSFYPLYKVVETIHGGKLNDAGAVSHFAVPDLRGLFIRGVAGDRQGNGSDPDRDKRLTPRPDLVLQGNEGNRPGSYQDWATAMPRGDKSFKASINSYPFSSTKGYQAGEANASSFGSGSTTFGSSGGDTETRPETFLVHWYCRFQSSPSRSKPGDEIPLGAILLAGTIEELSCWQPCQGQTLLINEYAPLFKIIGTAFGGDGKTSFCLPDLRGRILRGAGAADIVYPRPRGAPDGKAGATQTNSTGAPRAGLALTLANWPGGSRSDIIDYGTGTRLMKLDGDKTLDVAGGDPESRPVNLYIQHLIKVRAA